MKAKKEENRMILKLILALSFLSLIGAQIPW
jgi:hypothetical protein